MAGQLDEAAKQILGTLLADFTDRRLTASELNKGYEGPRIEALATAVCNIEDITSVDFEVAFSDLEKSKLIKTGPMAMYDNDRSSSVIFIGSYSKREFVYLTENGYKEARKAPNRPPRVQKIVNNLTISGGNFSHLQLAQGESNKQEFNVTESSDSAIINKLIKILESQGRSATAENHADITSAVAEANDGNAGAAKKLLAKAFGASWDMAQKIAVPVIAELVRKSLEM
ncbi:hypothetical protein TH60_14255 [Pantoea ananatis]|uniref:hypothetical protein n=1 Tax=Pantoea ananas TaxID=553 RepID=UPI001EE5F72F|nr:hypothetical protein [Pantoea ananatis]MDC7870662.1 hypothetical protein [Pantoea ananatis]PKC47783.1 hypothetical protein V461_00990 [Pantoea ananatis BRT98]